MRFDVSLERRSEQRLTVRLTLDRDDCRAATGGGDRGEVELYQATWTPGSYLVREYSAFVDEVAHLTDDRFTPTRKTKKNAWVVPAPAGGEGSLQILYTVLAADCSVRSAWASEDFAFWSGAPLLLWPRGCERRPAQVLIDLPSGWLAKPGQLAIREDRGQVESGYAVRSFAEALDVACVVAPEGAFKTVAFEAAGKPHEFVFAGLGPVGLPEHLADVSTRIVSENASVFGDEAALPYEAYRFLVLVSDGPRGGLEHDASSVLQHPRTGFRGRELEDFLGLVAHEHFHVWNVRRMRPVSLVDPDMEREVDTSDLWVAEGMTAYFDDLVCRRVGAIDEKRYLDILAGHWTTYLQSPGRLRQSLSESAADAWIRLYRPHPNLRNVTQNYYTHGSLAAACIDAMVRFDSDGERELDDVLRDLYARSYQAGRGFERRDIVAALDAVAPGRSWADEIRSLIDERSELPFVEWMERAYGLVVKTRGPKRASLGIQIRGGTTVVAFVRDGEAGRAGGLVPDDEIVAVDGLRIRADNWSAVFDATLRPGRKARLLVARQGRMQEIVVEPTVDGVREVRIEAETEATAQQRARRERWLGVRREAPAGRGSGIEAS